MPARLTRPARRNCSVRFDQLEVAEAARSTRHCPRAQALVDNRPGGGDSFATPVALVHVALDRHQVSPSAASSRKLPVRHVCPVPEPAKRGAPCPRRTMLVQVLQAGPGEIRAHTEVPFGAPAGTWRCDVRCACYGACRIGTFGIAKSGHFARTRSGSRVLSVAGVILVVDVIVDDVRSGWRRSGGSSSIGAMRSKY